MELIRNCSNCFNYQNFKPTENGLEYYPELRCAYGYDIKDNNELDSEFDRKCSRDCNVLDFWKVMYEDEDLAKFFLKDFTKNGNCEKTHKYFKNKYKLTE